MCTAVFGIAAMSYAGDASKLWEPPENSDSESEGRSSVQWGAIEKEEGVYAGIRLGLASLKVDGKVDGTLTHIASGNWASFNWTETIEGTIFSGAGLVGYKFSPYFRVEGELSYINGDIEDDSSDQGTLTFVAFKALGYLDIPIKDTAVVPYGVLGIGVANYKEDWEGWSYDGQGVSIDIGAGVGISVTENWTLDASLRYMLAKMPKQKTIDETGWLPAIAPPMLPAGNYHLVHNYEPTITAVLFQVGARYIF